VRRLWVCGGIVFPDTAGLELSETHHELAALDSLLVDVPADATTVGERGIPSSWISACARVASFVGYFACAGVLMK